MEVESEKKPIPLVGVVMGSQSAWSTMEHSTKILEDLDIAYEAKIVSAHRTPDRLFDYSKTACKIKGDHRRSWRSSSPPGHAIFDDASAGVRYSNPRQSLEWFGQPSIYSTNAGRHSGRHSGAWASGGD